MVEHDPEHRRPASPYSRTGLFPFGSTYAVPVRRDSEGATSQTPCHLHVVEIRDEDDARTRTRCPACGRLWTVVFAEQPRPHALWTA